MGGYIIIYLLFNGIAAFYFDAVAEKKGHNVSLFVLFLFGFVAMLYVAALPDLEVRKQNEKIIHLLDEQNRRYRIHNKVSVDSSAKKIDNNVKKKVLNKWNNADVKEGQVKCPSCGYLQKEERSVCWECGAKLNENVVS